MKIEDQVCSFEQAVKLYLLGFKCETVFSYEGFQGGNGVELTKTMKGEYLLYSAPNVAELGVLLIPFLRGEYCGLCAYYTENDAYQVCFPYLDREKIDFWHTTPEFDTEAQALADALIWLLENGHLKAGDLEL